MPNRLAAESSPYLLQHQHNPVAWQPWDEQALAQARQEQKPIFLSIGYSACHWCHVMEHESFENPHLAARMNADFVCIKVDREERPDLDQIYMHAVQLLTGRGGWPMSVFLTPDLRPFYGGTYWPPQARGGMPGFDQVLSAVAEAWRNRRPQVAQQAEHLTEHLQALALESAAGGDELSPAPLRAAETYLCRVFDETYGGFGGAPKFPHPMDLRLLLRGWRTQRNDRLLHVATHTLDQMAAGGIYDHLGGGFHRYSVDARWLVPHFEKMLYDNALLATVYVEAYQATGRASYAQVARETLDYVLREMTDPLGGFYSTQDADSEGEEGKFYVWTPAELQEHLGEAAAQRFADAYDVTTAGNFEGCNILHRPQPLALCAQRAGVSEAELAAELADGRARLLAVRNRRVPPGLDDKVLASWNGLMLEALALAGSALAEPRFVQAAQQAAQFLLTQMTDARGRLLHSWRQGVARGGAFLDDYASVAWGLFALHQADGDERWLAEAERLLEQVLAQFEDAENGGFYFTANDHERLIARTKDVQDGSVPSGNGLAATALLKLGRLTGNERFVAAGERALRAFGGLLERSPAALGQLLLGLDFHLTPKYELALVGPTAESLSPVRAAVGRRFLPHAVLACRVDATSAGPRPLDALFAGKRALDAQPTLYVCRDQACAAPLAGGAAIEAALDRLAGGHADSRDGAA